MSSLPGKKVKCDGEHKQQGSSTDSKRCSNCAAAGIECVFVPSMRGGRRVPKHRNGSLAVDHEDGSRAYCTNEGKAEKGGIGGGKETSRDWNSYPEFAARVGAGRRATACPPHFEPYFGAYHGFWPSVRIPVPPSELHVSQNPTPHHMASTSSMPPKFPHHFGPPCLPCESPTHHFGPHFSPWNRPSHPPPHFEHHHHPPHHPGQHHGPYPFSRHWKYPHHLPRHFHHSRNPERNLYTWPPPYGGPWPNQAGSAFPDSRMGMYRQQSDSCSEFSESSHSQPNTGVHREWPSPSSTVPASFADMSKAASSDTDATSTPNETQAYESYPAASNTSDASYNEMSYTTITFDHRETRMKTKDGHDIHAHKPSTVKSNFMDPGYERHELHVGQGFKGSHVPSLERYQNEETRNDVPVTSVTSPKKPQNSTAGQNLKSSTGEKRFTEDDATLSSSNSSIDESRSSSSTSQLPSVSIWEEGNKHTESRATARTLRYRLSSEDLLDYDLPPPSISCLLLDVFFEKIHLQLQVLPPKDFFMSQFSPRANTALIHAMFLCARPYLNMLCPLDNNHSFSADHYLGMIKKYRDRLDAITLMQTHILLSYYYSKYASDCAQVEYHLKEVAQFICSMPLPALSPDEAILSKLSSVTRMQRESYCRLAWSLFLMIRVGKECFGNSVFMHTDEDTDLCKRLKTALFTHVSLPFLDEDRASIPTGISTHSSFGRGPKLESLYEKCETSGGSSGCLYIAARLQDELIWSFEREQWMSRHDKFEKVVNRKVSETKCEGSLLILDTSAILAKTFLLLSKLDVVNAGHTKFDKSCLLNIEESHMSNTYFEGLKEAITASLVCKDGPHHINLLSLFLAILDCTALLNLCMGMSPESEVGSSARITLMKCFCPTPCKDIPDDEFFLHDKQGQSWWEFAYKVKQQELKNFLSEKQSSIGLNAALLEFKFSECSELWTQYPFLTYKLACRTLPLLACFHYLGTAHVFTETERAGHRLFTIKPREEPQCEEQSWSFEDVRTEFSKSLEWGHLASELTEDDAWELLVRLTEPSFWTNRFAVCAEFIKRYATILPNSDGITQNVDVLSSCLQKKKPPSSIRHSDASSIPA
ncbi:LAMI_0E14246g1_1 [Lachancea mirantina]|uniref:LAMI_0E14246g1_1 n=1 Tax=Lachancea mirantina TaxID=1230905 RepID=A0A1G4JRU3_9SACH|nr:LAMI_0E14246g1_1 [Lachancea mirantina]